MTEVQAPTARHRTAAAPRSGLEGALLDALDLYFEQLGNQKPHALHDMVMLAIERPLIQYALTRCEGNITKTSKLLGLTRNTLRKKISHHQIQTQIQIQPPAPES